MKKISLKGVSGKGKFAIVDDEDYDFLCQYKWYIKNGYATTNGYDKDKKKGILLYMHRLINKTTELMHTDHVNRNKLDNRRSNLRKCTAQQNGGNRPLHKKNKSGFRGVFFNKNLGIWTAVVSYDIMNGFSTKEEAAIARDKKAIEVWGEFAQLNYPKETYIK